MTSGPLPRSLAALAVASVVIGAGAVAAASSSNRAGDLDRSFSHDGQVLTNLKTGYPRSALDVAVDAHDRPIAVGSTYYAFATVRYHQNGSLDRSFSKDGKAELFAGNRNRAYATAVAVDQRGRIVVGGGKDDGKAQPVETDEFELARYRPSGALDKSFSKDGVRTLKLEKSGEEAIGDVAIDDRGRIVVTGYVGSGSPGVIARFHPNGELDRSFGHRGTTRIPRSYANAIAIDHDGNIFVTGRSAIFAFNPHGELEHGFGNSGRTSFPTRYAGPLAVSHGRIAIGGDDKGRLAVIALRKNGKRDRSFSGDGLELARRIGPPNGSASAYTNAIAIDDHRRIDVFGTSRVNPSGSRGTSDRLALARFKAGGGLDRSFSDDGVSVAKLKDPKGKPLRHSSATALAIDSRDRIVGTGENYASGGEGPFQLVRFLGR